jgi:hypothetical protein
MQALFKFCARLFGGCMAIKRTCCLAGLVAILMAVSPGVYAQQPATTTTTTTASSPSIPLTTGSLKGVKSEKTHIYQKPTIAKLSQLYWALGKFDLSSNDAVDNYLRINECDIFKDYHHNEFEWNQIRESGRAFLADNRKKFSLRVEFIQPIHFSDYDVKTGRFQIWDKYVLDGVRSFEVLASDIDVGVCNSGAYDIPGYPRGLDVELSRPFTLKSVPVRSDLAQKYILDKGNKYTDLKEAQQTQEMLYTTRDAYLVMQVKIFSYDSEFVTQQNYALAKILAVLESYEIYSDKGMQELLYSENTKKKKQRSGKEEELKKKYQERLKKKMAEDRAASQSTATKAPTPGAP